MAVKLVSAARHNYGGRSLSSGDPFEAENEQDAEDLIALRFAVRAAPKVPPKRRRRYKRRDMVAEE